MLPKFIYGCIIKMRQDNRGKRRYLTTGTAEQTDNIWQGAGRPGKWPKEAVDTGRHRTTNTEPGAGQRGRGTKLQPAAMEPRPSTPAYSWRPSNSRKHGAGYLRPVLRPVPSSTDCPEHGLSEQSRSGQMSCSGLARLRDVVVRGRQYGTPTRRQGARGG